MERITPLIIGIIVVVLCVTVFSGWLASTSVRYGTTYNESEWDAYNKSVEIEQMSNKLSNTNLTVDSSILDRVGAYISKGLTLISIGKTSVDLAIGNNGMLTDVAERKLNLPGYFLPLVLAILVVLIFIGFLGGVITGRLRL